MSSKSRDYVPILKTKGDLAIEARNKIDQERSGKQLGLRTSFPKLNVAVGRWFRFGQVTSINGLSGHGKSTLLNYILRDFTNPSLNSNYIRPVVVAHNSFEMLPVDEVLRNVSSKLEVSHLHLLSSEMREDQNGVGAYNVISDKEFEEITNALQGDENLNHYYFEDATTVSGIIKNVNYSIEYYQDTHQTTVVPSVVTALDHTLLVEGDKGQNQMDVITMLGKAGIYLKKRGHMVLFVGQLNNNIEQPERLKNVDLHFPVKSDIYAQAQLYNACDNVLIIHQPELLGITEYGKNRYNTSDLVHLQLIKQRFGKVGSIWLKNEFHKGRLVDMTPTQKLIK